MGNPVISLAGVVGQIEHQHADSQQSREACARTCGPTVIGSFASWEPLAPQIKMPAAPAAAPGHAAQLSDPNA